MLYKLKKITMEQWFLIVAFVMSLILSFLLGYTIFRYWQIEACKTLMEVV